MEYSDEKKLDDSNIKSPYPSEICIINKEYIKHKDSFGQWEYWFSKFDAEEQSYDTSIFKIIIIKSNLVLISKLGFINIY